MSRQPGPESLKILVNHWRWLEDQGPSYKQQAASCKRQAASLTAVKGYCRINVERINQGNYNYKKRTTGNQQ